MARKSIAKNYIYNLIYQMLVIVLPLITTPYLSRVLGSDGIGTFSYTMSIVTFFILFGSMGVSLYGQRTIAYTSGDKKESSKKFFELVIIKTITLFISMIVFYFCFAIRGNNILYYKILLIEIVANIFDISWFFQGKEDFDKLVVRNLIVKLLCLILIFTCVKSRQDLWIYFLIYVSADLLGNLSMWLYLPKYLVKVSMKELNYIPHIIPMILLFLPQIAIQIYTVLDKTMIGVLTSNMSEVGYYEQAQKIVKAALLVLTSLQTVMNSRVAIAYAKHDYNEIKGYLENSIKFVWFLGIAMLGGIIGISSGLVYWYYGEGFDKIELILIATAPIIMAIGFNSIFGVQYLVQVNKTKEFTISVVVGASLNFVLNLFLIPIFGGLGAAFASVVSEVTIAIIQYRYLKKDFNDLSFLKSSFKPILAGILMFIVVKFLDINMSKSIFSTLIQIFIGAIIYLLVLICLRFKFLFDIIDQILGFLKSKGGIQKVSSQKKKVLLYNWVQFDKKEGGGVTVYIDNIISDLKNNENIDLYFISSGTNYNLFSKKIKIKKTKNKYGNLVKSYTIYNSPVMIAYNQFSRVDIYNEDQKMVEVFNQFIEKYGEFDIIHFNNLEGLSLNVLKLKEKYPKTKFIYSMHNYFPVCPNVFLWQHNKENCKNYRDGKACCNCVISDYEQARRMLKIKTLLEKFRINLQAKWIKNLYNKLKKNSNEGKNEILAVTKPLNKCKANDYKKFREQNVKYLNKYVDDILCVSRRVKEIAIHYGIKKEKCHVSYIGTKFANHLQRQDIDIHCPKFNLIYLGYMNPMKGFDFLIEALDGLDKKIAMNVNLYLVCRNDPNYNIEEIKNRLDEKFASVIYIDGYSHDTLSSLLKGKHLGVIPVVWEDNLPQVAIEVTSFGVPILASDLGGASELCDNTDFKFKGGDVKDFQKKLTNIIENREKLQEFWDFYNKPTTMEQHLEELYQYYGMKEKKK